MTPTQNDLRRALDIEVDHPAVDRVAARLFELRTDDARRRPSRTGPPTRRLAAAATGGLAVAAAAAVALVLVPNGDHQNSAGGPSTGRPTARTTEMVAAAALGPSALAECTPPPGLQLVTSDSPMSKEEFGPYHVLTRGESDGKPFVMAYQNSRNTAHFELCPGFYDNQSQDTYLQVDPESGVSAALGNAQPIVRLATSPTERTFIAGTVSDRAVSVVVTDADGQRLGSPDRYLDPMPSGMQLFAGYLDGGSARPVTVTGYDAQGRKVSEESISYPECATSTTPTSTTMNCHPDN